MRIILFGSNGMLGSYLKKYLNDRQVVSLTRSDIDISTSSGSEINSYLINTIRLSKSDVIINAAGVIKQREYNVKDMITVNSLFPHILSDIKKQIGCEVVHVTTDCVFSGNVGKYIESDQHDCLDDYGKSKSLGEPTDITVIRTSIIGEEGSNKKSLIEWVKSNKGKIVSGYENHLWNGVTCLELSKFIEYIIDSNLYWDGVKHIFSNTVSKYELVSMINEIYKLDMVVNKVDTPNNCFRNLSSVSDCSYIFKNLYEQIKELREFEI